MKGREVVSLGGVGHGEISEGFFGLTLLIETSLHDMTQLHYKNFPE